MPPLLKFEAIQSALTNNHLNFFKGFIPEIINGSFLNTLVQENHNSINSRYLEITNLPEEGILSFCKL